MNILGIDPGNSGALAVLRCEGDQIDLVSVHSFPRLRRKVSGSAKEEIDLAGLCVLLRGLIDAKLTAYLERVGAMPGQGVSSMFTFGRAVGQVEALLVALGCPTQYVTPRIWKSRFSLTAEKDESLRVAKLLWPAQAYLFDLGNKRDSIAVAEAALIGRYGAERELALRRAVAVV